jgi:FkbM family methyltransferase
MKSLIKKAISSFGVEAHRSSRGRTYYAMDFLDMLRQDSSFNPVPDFIRYAALHARRSHAELFQDLFVINTLDEKRGGYFVEFGAADGVFFSNSLLLERDFGWRGIVAEPSLSWHDSLKANRRCSIDLRCVWSSTGETLTFSETPNAGLSTVTKFKATDYHDRSAAKEYQVQTVSLNDLLREHGAPEVIDYLSIDTEGSESHILRSLDFSKWSFRIITVEHNFTKARSEIHSLLSSKGYKRILSEITRWDDWYVLTN